MRQQFSHNSLQQTRSLTCTQNYRNFVHIDSLICTAAKYSVYTAALYRFPKNCSTPSGFSANAARLMQKMVAHGYRYQRLRSRLYKFRRAKYEWMQLQVFHKHRHNTSKSMWRRLTRQCNRKIRSLKKQSRLLKARA